MSVLFPQIGSYLSTQFVNALTGSSSSSKASTTSASSIDPSSLSIPQDGNPQLSPFAQILSQLQQLQQQNPTQYQQVTQQIASNLKTASQTAQSEGNTARATQLNQLSNDFQTASSSGQLPNVTDLAQAIHGHHHHHHHAAPASGSTDSASDSTTGSNSNQGISQLLAAFQTSTAQNDALNPMTIIQNTLASAGITPAAS